MNWAVRHPAATVPLVLAGIGCGSSATRPDPVPAADRSPEPVVVALGDSLTAGAGLRSDEAYPARLQEQIAAHRYPHRVVNAGVSGDTTAAALRRLDARAGP